MRSLELDPKIERLAEALLDSGDEEFGGVYPITETMACDAGHPKVRIDPFDAGSAVHEALARSGLSHSDIIALHPVYLESLTARRPDAEEIGLQRQSAANILNRALGVRPFDQQG